MSGFVHEMRASGNGMLVRVSMIAAIGGFPASAPTRHHSAAVDPRQCHGHEAPQFRVL